MVKRTQRILQAVGATACPESWYSFEIKLLRMARVLTFLKPTRNIRYWLGMWRSAGVLRLWHVGRDAL
jgi:hypothetical protein